MRGYSESIPKIKNIKITAFGNGNTLFGESDSYQSRLKQHRRGERKPNTKSMLLKIVWQQSKQQKKKALSEVKGWFKGRKKNCRKKLMNRKINSIPIVRIKTGKQDRRTIMEKHIMGENGISYTLGEDSLYYLDLYLPEEIIWRDHRNMTPKMTTEYTLPIMELLWMWIYPIAESKR